MRFEDIYSERRVGSNKASAGSRSGFQRDFDRLIFSSAFRRLQNKTQVFPLPGIAFVHNRLTHSLEVASVGRSLGKIIGKDISEQFRPINEDAYEFYRYELANVIAAGCLAHDIGNPAFGHSGEKAISTYFIEHASENIEGTPLRDYFNEAQWQDLCNFEGNANAIRVLTHSFRGRFKGGFGLTYTTIGSILKYPCESLGVDKGYKHRKKYGYFQSEKEVIEELARTLHMPLESESPQIFSRHPFVYLVEAADDICYNIVDMEDAQRLRILRKKEVEDCFMNILKAFAGTGEDVNKSYKYYSQIEDDNEALAFLRARVINVLTNHAAAVFLEHRGSVLDGKFNNTLMDYIESSTGALREVKEISISRIYNHDTVIQIEIAGYNVMSELLNLFVPALLKKDPQVKEKKVLQLFPYQFTEFELTNCPYEKVLSALDHLSSMTDEFATVIYKRLKGIEIPRH